MEITNKEKHPLYGSWRWMCRMSIKNEVHPAWKEDFSQFIKDMGEKPEVGAQLRRKDTDKGYSPENCYWLMPRTNESKAAYAREYRKKNPERIKNTELKKRFGITLDDFNNMLEKQDHVCAICHNPQHTDNSLAVDHCHSTNKVRGLLCTNCNKLLGHAKDNQETLLSAVEYLRLA